MNDRMTDLDDFIGNAIREDIGEGDHSSMACIPVEVVSTASLYAKEEGILAGEELARMIFSQIDPELKVECLITDGQSVYPGAVVMKVEGNARSILKAERLVLNCMQRMSGIATLTRKFVESIGDLECRVLDTRKTTPGSRVIEKWAVRIGGGANHRQGLYDMIMIKDNHIDFAGGIAVAVQETVKYLRGTGKDLMIEIESRNIEEVKKILEIGQVHRIMLDNFSIPDLKTAVELIDRTYETEASGGISLENVRQYAESGVDFVSVGALTHQARSLDMSLKAAH